MPLDAAPRCDADYLVAWISGLGAKVSEPSEALGQERRRAVATALRTGNYSDPSVTQRVVRHHFPCDASDGGSIDPSGFLVEPTFRHARQSTGGLQHARSLAGA